MVFRFARAKRCVRCGSRRDVQTVKYLRRDEKRTEPWCDICRRAKLSRRAPDALSTEMSGTEMRSAGFWGRLDELDRP